MRRAAFTALPIPACRLLGQQPQGVGLGLGRRRRFGCCQLGRGAGVAPGPQVELQQVGGHQGQPPASHLAHHGGYAHDAQQDGLRPSRTSEGPKGK